MLPAVTSVSGLLGADNTDAIAPFAQLMPTLAGNIATASEFVYDPHVPTFSESTFAAIILLFCYYAQGVVITLLLSILLAYFLDPAVELLERAGVPRTVGAMAMVLLLILVLVAVGYGLGTRIANFSDNWPKYGSVLRGAADAVEGKINGIEGRVAPVGGAAGQWRIGFQHL